MSLLIMDASFYKLTSPSFGLNNVIVYHIIVFTKGMSIFYLERKMMGTKGSHVYSPVGDIKDVN